MCWSQNAKGPHSRPRGQRGPAKSCARLQKLATTEKAASGRLVALGLFVRVCKLQLQGPARAASRRGIIPGRRSEQGAKLRRGHSHKSAKGIGKVALVCEARAQTHLAQTDMRIAKQLLGPLEAALQDVLVGLVPMLRLKSFAK